MCSFDLRVMNMGAGVQSSTLFMLSLHGELPMPDVAIFADTQQEPPWVYEQVEWLKRQAGPRLPIIDATAGDLGEDLEQVPFHVMGEDGRPAKLNRDCTRDYKIRVARGAIRRILGLRPRARAAGVVSVEQWIGISIDEADRAKSHDPEAPWITLRHPLLQDRPMSRLDCENWLTAHGYHVPSRSACVMCPFRSNSEWRRIRAEEPDVWRKACEVDQRIRAKPLRGVIEQPYVHKSLRPLAEARLDSSTGDLFGEECAGVCNV